MSSIQCWLYPTVAWEGQGSDSASRLQAVFQVQEHYHLHGGRLEHAFGAPAICMPSDILVLAKSVSPSGSCSGRLVIRSHEQGKPVTTPIRRELDAQVSMQGSKVHEM